MAVEKRQYETSFKQEALRLLEMSRKSVRQIEDELGITSGLLNKGKTVSVRCAIFLLCLDPILFPSNKLQQKDAEFFQ